MTILHRSQYKIALFFAAVVFAGCMHDKVSHRHTFQRALFTSLAQARQSMKSSPAKSLVSPGKIAVYKNYLFVSDPLLGIHVIDNKNPAAPVNLSYLPVYGNTNLAISDDVLYADDGYNELVAFDLSNPTNISAKKFIRWAFNFGPDTTAIPTAPLDSIQVVYGFETVDTTIYGDDAKFAYPAPCVSCSFATINDIAPAGGTGTAGVSGSTSAFTIKDNYLYCLNGALYLDVIDINNRLDPELVKMTSLDDYYQTIFSLNNTLFMGSATGMYIYNATDPLNVTKAGTFAHVPSCDPVIAEGNFAFVTSWSGSLCGAAYNELNVLDITNISIPVPISSYKLTNPRGLAKDGNLLLICDGKDGLCTFNVTDNSKVTLLHTAEAMEAHDVIAANGLAIVTAADGIHQYSYSPDGTLKKLSSIVINEKN